MSERDAILHFRESGETVLIFVCRGEAPRGILHAEIGETGPAGG